MPVSEQAILERFREAIEKGYIHPWYQPVYRTYSRKICDAEALARWEDPKLGRLMPDGFVPVLEEHDLIYDLDMAILKRTCQFYSELRQRGTLVHSFSVNISRMDFKRPRLFEDVDDILRQYGVPTHAIKIEITESTMQEDLERFHQVFNQFHEAGYSVWVDDFGSGYSSLNMLQNYEFNMLKIDMLFLRNFGNRSRKVISSVVNMAKSMGIHTLAEGVETEEHYLFMKEIGCELIQGYYFSKPLAEGDFIALLDGNTDVIEPYEDKAYWNTIGLFNPLSVNPLEAFRSNWRASDGEEGDYEHGEMPLALIEHTGHRAFYLYANDAYLERVKDLGARNLTLLERAFNDRISPQYAMIKSVVMEAIARETVQEVDYVFGGVYYKFKTRCLAKAPGKVMLAASLRTFETQTEEKLDQELKRFSQALFATYEHVVILYPGRDTSERLFSTANFQQNYAGGSLKAGIQGFCGSQVFPEDQARYLRFFDMDTLKARTCDPDQPFIEQVFRLTDEEGGYRWRTIRITKIPSFTDDIYLYTIQKLSELEARVSDMLVREHPELLG